MCLESNVIIIIILECIIYQPKSLNIIIISNNNYYFFTKDNSKLLCSPSNSFGAARAGPYKISSNTPDTTVAIHITLCITQSAVVQVHHGLSCFARAIHRLCTSVLCAQHIYIILRSYVVVSNVDSVEVSLCAEFYVVPFSLLNHVKTS